MKVNYGLILVIVLASWISPLFHLRSSGFQNIQQIAETYADDYSGGLYSWLSEGLEWTDEQVNPRQHEPVSNPNHFIFYSFDSGYTPIGATKMAIKNARYSIYEPIQLLGSTIAFILLIQLLLMRITLRHGNGILAIINLLLLIALLGNCVEHEFFQGFLFGALSFIGLQSAYLVIHKRSREQEHTARVVSKSKEQEG
ncbi:MAG: hypothetical protein ACQERC_09520 [Bacteroidota bacterium]